MNFLYANEYEEREGEKHGEMISSTLSEIS